MSFFKKIKDSFKNAFTPKKIDTALFNDSLAEKTEWSPAKRGGASFKTHQLSQPYPYRIEFSASLGAKIFYFIFLIIGIGLIVGMSYAYFTSPRKEHGMLIGVFAGLVFAGAGGAMLYFGTRPIVFDNLHGYFWKGAKRPPVRYGSDNKKALTRLEQIHAIQIIKEYVRSDKSSYYSYELNLVLKDASRINVIDHGNYKVLLADADTLAKFLNVPVWDAS